jgi:TatD DNase family protein
MPLVDTHCHLQDDKFEADYSEVLERALETLDWLVVIGDDLPSSRAALNCLRDRVYAVVGMHPYHASQVDDACLEELRLLAGQPGVVGLGEMGLDYFNEFSPRTDQKPAFEKQLELACELSLPVVIHNRDADDDSYAILKNVASDLKGCIMHCFGSDAAFAERCVDLGFYISFAGNVTFPKAQPLRDAAAVVPLDRLLVETDAPYLAPQPKRGRRCEPQFVEHTAQCLAELKNVDMGEFADATTANARRVYGLD